MADLSDYQVTGTNLATKQVSVTAWNNFLAAVEDAIENSAGGVVNPVDFGVVAGNSGGANGAANSAAMSTLFTAIRALSISQSSKYRGHPWVRFPVGYFEFASTIEMDYGTFSIEGMSTGGPAGQGTELKFPAGVTGIRVQYESTSGATGGVVATHYTGHGSTIKNLCLKGGFSSDEGEAHGIHLRARANIENCFILEFEGDGIHSHANLLDATYHGNSNLTYVQNCRIQECRHGIYVDGADANIWVIIAVDASSNRGWGFFDSSFLGNTYIGCHAASNGHPVGTAPSSVVSHGGNRYYVVVGQEAGASTNAPSGTTANNTWWNFRIGGGASSSWPAWVSGATYRTGGSYHSDNANARNCYVGCYHEGDEGDPQLVTPSLVLGGMMAHSVIGTGGVVDTVQGVVQTNRAFEATATTSGGATFKARIGESDGASQTGLYMNDTAAFPSTWRIRVSGNDILGDYANTSTARAFRITGPSTTEQFGTGAAVAHAMYIPHLCVGDDGENAANARRMMNGTAAPASGAHGAGEIVWNRAPSSGNPMGWICSVAGTPGTWLPLANVP